MSKWSEFYQNRLNDRYIEHLKSKYDFFLSLIENKIEEIRDNYPSVNINIIELGAGCGNIIKILYDRFEGRCSIRDNSGQRMSFMTIEKDPDMATLLEKNLHTMDINKIYGDILSVSLNKDLFLMNSANIIISHGLLEHLSDSQIRKIMDRRIVLNGAYYHFHYVPSFKYNEPSFGDERLMIKSQWKHILDNTLTNLKIQHFNEGYDFVISGEVNNAI
jgi:phospholipid N-methyltransferase